MTKATALASAPFEFRGATYRVYKKRTDPSAPWYYQYQIAGRRFPTRLDTPTLSSAIDKAKLIIIAHNKGRLEELAKIRALLSGKPVADPAAPQCAAIESYLKFYEETPSGRNSQTSRRQAANALRRLTACAPGIQRIDQLETAFRAAHAAAARKIEAEADQGRRLSMKRSFNSTLRNAASVFSEDAVLLLGNKAALPDFSALRALVKKLRYPDVKKTAMEYKRPDETILAATFAAWTGLPRNEFLAVGLALCASLRRGEIRQAAFNWCKEHDGWRWIDATGNFKDGTGVLRVRLLDPFYSLMRSHAEKQGWWATDGPVIVTNVSEFDRNVSAWMRGLGWQTKKHLHALRAWAGSLVYMRFGAGAACKFCRHGDEATTRDFYGWMRSDEWADQKTAVLVAGKTVEWAKC